MQKITHRQADLKYVSKHTKTDKGIEVFNDNDFSGNGVDRKSTTGAFITFHNKAIGCRSGEKIIVVMSTAEAEYVSMEKTIQVKIIVIKLVRELNIQSKSDKIPTWCDNKASLKIMKDRGCTKRRKFIDLIHNYIQKTSERCMMKIGHVPNGQQKLASRGTNSDEMTYRLLTRGAPGAL